MTTVNGEAADAALTIVTCNVRYGTAEDGPNHWRDRRELLLGTLRGLDPDVLCLQEPLGDQLDEIVRAFPGYGRLGVGRIDGERDGEWAAILVRESRLETEGSGTFWLSETPDVPGSRGWDAAFHPRICTWGELRDRRTDRQFKVMNSHWDNEGEWARLHSAGMIAVAAGAEDSPVIVTGDFNDTPDSPAVRYLLGEQASLEIAHGEFSYPPSPRFRDSAQVALRGADAGGTFHGFTGAEDGPRIDYILVREGITVREYRVVRVNERGRYPSDHFPVMATVVL